MGHVHLGELPRTRRWKQVVRLIEGGADAASVAQAAMEAAHKGLLGAAKDDGLQQAVGLLMHLPAAARSGDFVQQLAEVGVEIVGAPTAAEIVGAVSDHLDEAIPADTRTELNEMAQMSVAETLADVLGRGTAGMFEVAPADVQRELGKLANVGGMGILMHTFFARLMNRYLGYYLSRELTHHVGEGRRFATLAQHGEFSAALALHTRQAAVIVQRFSGEWASKTRWKHGGIGPRHLRDFVHGATRKLSKELLAGAT